MMQKGAPTIQQCVLLSNISHSSQPRFQELEAKSGDLVSALRTIENK